MLHLPQTSNFVPTSRPDLCYNRTNRGVLHTSAPQGGMFMQNKEPDHIQVQHILIGFTGSVQGKRITRSKEEAKTLAYQLLDQARAGADFDALVRQHTDDSPPGIYGMSNIGVPPAKNEYARD